MELTDIVKEVLEDYNNIKSPSEIWKTLEKRMKKDGFKKEYKKITDKTDSLKAYNLLKVLDAVDKYLKKHNNPWYYDYTETVFKVINAISEIDEIEEIIKMLGESGYEPTFRSYPFTFAYIPEESIEIFETLAKDKLYKKYGLISQSLKSLGYKGVSSYAKAKPSVDIQQLNYLINLTSVDGDVPGAVYILANKSYKIDKDMGLNKLDVSSIKKIVEADKKERAEGKGGIPFYLYNTGNAELFQGYFNSMEAEKKKSVLRSILDHDSENASNPVKGWLEKNYENLLREVGFEDVK